MMDERNIRKYIRKKPENVHKSIKKLVKLEQIDMLTCQSWTRISESNRTKTNETERKSRIKIRNCQNRSCQKERRESRLLR